MQKTIHLPSTSPSREIPNPRINTTTPFEHVSQVLYHTKITPSIAFYPPDQIIQGPLQLLPTLAMLATVRRYTAMGHTAHMDETSCVEFLFVLWKEYWGCCYFNAPAFLSPDADLDPDPGVGQGEDPSTKAIDVFCPAYIRISSVLTWLRLHSIRHKTCQK